MKKFFLIFFTIIGGILVSANFVLAANLNVPFSSQAPHGDWSQPWFDACEETSLVMVDYYYKFQSLAADVAVAEILKVFDYKNKTLGPSLDEGADKIIFLINNLYSWEAYKVSNPSLSLIKQEIDFGRPVIIPVAGDLLGNPYFRGSVPYHVIVIKGYDDAEQQFICNDPGTQYGADLRYLYSTVMNAMHDFVTRDSQQMLSGEKVAIFTKSENSGFSGFNGSLLKAYNDSKVFYIENNSRRHIINEQVFLANGWQWSQIKTVSYPVLYSISQGLEINTGIFSYQLTAFELSLSSGSLIKSNFSPRIYLLENNFKRYIVSPDVFEKNNWRWRDIKIVSQQFIDSLDTAADLK